MRVLARELVESFLYQARHRVGSEAFRSLELHGYILMQAGCHLGYHEISQMNFLCPPIDGLWRQDQHRRAQVSLSGLAWQSFEIGYSSSRGGLPDTIFAQKEEAEVAKGLHTHYTSDGVNRFDDAYGAVLPYVFVELEEFRNVYAALPLPGCLHPAPCAGNV